MALLGLNAPPAGTEPRPGLCPEEASGAPRGIRSFCGLSELRTAKGRSETEKRARRPFLASLLTGARPENAPRKR